MLARNKIERFKSTEYLEVRPGKKYLIQICCRCGCELKHDDFMTMSPHDWFRTCNKHIKYRLATIRNIGFLRLPRKLKKKIKQKYPGKYSKGYQGIQIRNNDYFVNIFKSYNHWKPQQKFFKDYKNENKGQNF